MLPRPPAASLSRKTDHPGEYYSTPVSLVHYWQVQAAKFLTGHAQETYHLSVRLCIAKYLQAHAKLSLFYITLISGAMVMAITHIVE